MTEPVEQWICTKFHIKLEHSLLESIQMIQNATAMGNQWLAASPGQRACSGITSCADVLVKHQITQVTQPRYSPDLAPCDFWLFPKLKSRLKGKRFQTLDEIQENMMEQLMAIGKTVWGPKVPYFEGDWGTIVLCTMFFVSCIFFNNCVSFS